MDQHQEPVQLPQSWAQDWIVDRQLGSGAFSTVYHAVRRDGLGIDAAIKVISIPSSQAEADTLRNEGYNDLQAQNYYDDIARRYVSEIRMMESFKGMPNIVSIEDYKLLRKTSGIGNIIYIRMEMLTPLSDLMRKHFLPEHDVLRIGIDLCTALEVCEAKKIIHRDIKPANIFCNDKAPGHVFYKLGDFGIARSMEALTQGLSAKGTPSYMAPEVFLGKTYDHRVDLYSLGITLYLLLNENRLPLMPEGDYSVSAREAAMGRRMAGEKLPPPCRGSKAAGRTILRACEFDPARRFANAAEMKASLEAALNGKEAVPSAAVPADEPTTELLIEKRVPSPAPGQPSGMPPRQSAPPVKKKKKGLLIGAVAALVVAGAVLAAVLLSGGKEEKPTPSPEPTATYPPVLTSAPAPTPAPEPIRIPEPAETTAETSTPPSAPTPTPAPEQVAGYGMALGDDVPVRDRAGTNGKIIAALSRSKVVKILGQEYADGVPWHVIQFDSSWGYTRYDMLRILSPIEEQAYLESLATASPDPTAAPTPTPTPVIETATTSPEDQTQAWFQSNPETGEDRPCIRMHIPDTSRTASLEGDTYGWHFDVTFEETHGHDFHVTRFQVRDFSDDSISLTDDWIVSGGELAAYFGADRTIRGYDAVQVKFSYELSNLKGVGIALTGTDSLGNVYEFRSWCDLDRSSADPASVSVSFQAEPADKLEAGEYINRYGIINTNAVNIREGAGTENDKITRLNQGDVVYVIVNELNDDGEKWSRILYENTKAYVRSKYLDVMSAEASAAYAAENNLSPAVYPPAPELTPDLTPDPAPTATPASGAVPSLTSPAP